jgi:hypothetical protein
MITDNNLWKNQNRHFISLELRKYLDESNKKVVYKIYQSIRRRKEKID